MFGYVTASYKELTKEQQIATVRPTAGYAAASVSSPGRLPGWA